MDEKPKTWKRRLSRLLAGAVLAASIMLPSKAKADPPVAEDHSSITIGGRISQSPGLSLSLIPPTLHYSGFSYEIGDEDFRMDGGGPSVPVMGFIRNLDLSSPDSLGTVLDFSRRFRENLGLERPGSYHHRVNGSAEGFGEIYRMSRIGAVRGEIGVYGHLLARGSAFMDLDLDYEGELIPLRVDSRVRSGYHGSLSSSYGMGMETGSGTGSLRFGYGVMARRYYDFESSGLVDASLYFDLLSGHRAGSEVDFRRLSTDGTGFLPYFTMRYELPWLRQNLNAGLDFRYETESERRRHLSAYSGGGHDWTAETKYDSEIRRLLVVPRVSYVAGFGNGDVFPVISIDAGERVSGRGLLGFRAERLFMNASLSSGLDAGSEALILLRGTLSSREYSNYLFESESARAGFFPAWRSRVQRARSALLSSGERIMLRSAVDYRREFSETSAEAGAIYSNSRFYIDSGLRVFTAENVGGGLYNTIGTGRFFTTQSYSASLAGPGPRIHSFLFSIGGSMP